MRRSTAQWLAGHARARAITRGRNHFSTNAGAQVPVQCLPLTELVHQSRLHVQVGDNTRTNLLVIPTLNENEFALKVFGDDSDARRAVNTDVFRLHSEETQSGNVKVATVRLLKQDVTPALGNMTVHLFVPHLIDLHLSVVNGNVQIRDKIEGDVHVAVGEGNVQVNKVRGEVVDLKTNNGRVDVSTLLEGERVKMAASAVICKRLMAGKSEIKLTRGDGTPKTSQFGAIYSPITLINSMAARSRLHVGNSHGFLRVLGDDLTAVQIDSVNGSLHLEDSGPDCKVAVHFDAWQAEAENSILVGGDVAVSIEPSAPVRVELHGRSIKASNCAFGLSELEQLDEDYAMLTGEVKAVDGSSGRLSSASSGKINVGSAKTDALRTSFFAKEAESNDTETDDSEADGPASDQPRLLVHTSNGSVKLEQLDWMAKLKRKHLKAPRSTA
ncbi:TPA: hypothetical protein N0F65_005114 [Lagenidium giganteum]|uniref:Adhesin domain-containing protein n=1 Tax=Lagenidium giganteum TaxID=4803 RepID=A0AAV2ZBD6_9STRA|nr:TPA: hypothetical protein N0F65_005114 [Lagenidium giganteum]